MVVMKELLLIFFIVISTSYSAFTQETSFFPDVNNYHTLQCDFHMHTVFSDGLVWPDLRITEAVKDNLDVIAITDHIEYRPHKNELKGDHNRAFEIAVEAGKEKGVLVIHGVEITRPMPPGHLNALFINDANKIETKNVSNAIKEADSQGGFIVWNHPGWKAQQPDTTKWFDEHTELYENGLLDGIEIFNYSEFYPEALAWANEKNLTMFANSDVHQTIRTGGFGAHRPITLVFVTACNTKSVEDALREKQTACYFNDTVVAFETQLLELLNASLQIQQYTCEETGYTIVSLTNICSCPIRLKLATNNFNEIPDEIIVAGKNTTKIRFKSPDGTGQYAVYNTMNWLHNVDAYGHIRIPLN